MKVTRVFFEKHRDYEGCEQFYNIGLVEDEEGKRLGFIAYGGLYGVHEILQKNQKLTLTDIERSYKNYYTEYNEEIKDAMNQIIKISNMKEVV